MIILSCLCEIKFKVQAVSSPAAQSQAEGSSIAGELMFFPDLPPTLLPSEWGHVFPALLFASVGHKIFLPLTLQNLKKKQMSGP